jgi:type II secretion system protein G
MSAKSRQSLFRAKLAQHILSASKGFTLIELLVVIVIVGILSAVAIPQFLNQVRRSRTAEAQAALTAVGRASEVYRLDFGASILVTTLRLSTAAPQATAVPRGTST